MVISWQRNNFRDSQFNSLKSFRLLKNSLEFIGLLLKLPQQYIIPLTLFSQALEVVKRSGDEPRSISFICLTIFYKTLHNYLTYVKSKSLIWKTSSRQGRTNINFFKAFLKFKF